jgi:hypothetical protein
VAGENAGRRVGRFLLGPLLGTGGTASVYAGTDEQTGAAVSVKLLTTPEPDVRERLAVEAKVVGTIDSPHLMRLVDIVEDGSDLALVHRLVDGVTVEQLLKSGPLPLHDALAVAGAAALGLAAAHGQGIVHRDIKPSNILVPRRGDALSFRDAIVMDFGALGKLDRSTARTMPGMVVGTPTYMSPEQLAGSPQGPETDVYGLAAVLFEMLYGRPLHGATHLYDLLRQVMQGEIVFPDESRLPAGLRELLTRALSKSMADRPRDAAAFYLDLSSVQAELSAARPRGSTLSPIPASGPPDIAIAVGTAQPGGLARAIALPQPSGPAALVAMTVASLAGGTLGLLFLRLPWSWLAFGVCLAVAGVAGGLAVHHFLAAQESDVSRRATNLLIGAESRDSLTESLAIHVDQLWERCRTGEQQIVWHTIAMMVRELREARDSGDRQDALMNMVTLVGELQRRLSPWYVRKEKAISFGVGVVGIASGATSTVIAIAKALG